MKFCPRCQEVKPAEEFNRSSSKPDGLQSRCRVCSSEANKESYAQHSERVKARVAVRNALVRRANARRLRQYKRRFGCRVCGERSPKLLTFRRSTGALVRASEMKGHAWAWPTILKVIKTCTVECLACAGSLPTAAEYATGVPRRIRLRAAEAPAAAGPPR